MIVSDGDNLADVRVYLARLEKASVQVAEQLNRTSVLLSQTTDRLGIAIEELTALAQTEAIPLFFRQQIGAALTRIREVEAPPPLSPLI